MIRHSLGLSRYIAAVASAWSPREPIPLAEWCSREIHLPLTSGPNPRIDLDRFAYIREMLAAAEDPEVDEIILMTATQVGKTTALQLILAGLAVLYPAPAMLCAPDRDAVKKLRDKFYALCDASPILAARVPPRHKRNMSEIDFGASICHLAWTGNPQRVSGESCRVVLVTETDRSHRVSHEGALHKLIGERVKAWHNSLKVFEGTPTDEHSVIDMLYQQSTRERFLVPCPHCGQYQVLRFFLPSDGEHAGRGGVDGYKDPQGNYLSPDAAEAAGFYRCLNDCRIEDCHKPAMIAAGRWCPAGCQVAADGSLSGQPERNKTRRGFGWLSSLYADTITFGRMAREYLESREHEQSYQSFLNNWCGMRYRPRTKTPRAYELYKRLKSPYRRGYVPPEALFLTAGCDVQDNGSYWVVRAWGAGCTSWLVDWGFCPISSDAEGKRTLGSQLTPLQGVVIERDWPVEGKTYWGHATLRVLKTAIDCAHEPAMVHDFVRHFHADLVLTVAGDTKPQAGLRYNFSVVDRNLRTGKVYPGGLKRWAINTPYYLTDIQGRWQAPLDEPGAWWLNAADYDELRAYLDQITNMGRVSKTDRRGLTVMHWECLRPSIGEHYCDCETYLRAAADMVVGGIWDHVVERFRPARPDTPAHPQDQASKDFNIKSRGKGFMRG